MLEVEYLHYTSQTNLFGDYMVARADVVKVCLIHVQYVKESVIGIVCKLKAKSTGAVPCFLQQLPLNDISYLKTSRRCASDLYLLGPTQV
jgi:hypothetical protein